MYIYIDYKDFNAFIIKNCNILLLIREILQQLYKIKYYTIISSILLLSFTKFEYVLIINTK